MDIRLVISADESALEFARNLGKLFSAYVSESDIEAGVCGKFQNAISATVEPDTMPWEDEVEKGRTYYAQAKQNAEANAKKAIEEHDKKQAEQAAVEVKPEDLRAKSIAFSKANGKEAMRLILDKLGVQKLSDLDGNGRALAMQMIEEASNA